MNMQAVKSNIPLVIGLLLPVLMILFVAGSIYLPSLGEKAQPQYDFLYGVDTSYGAPGTYQYFVRGGKLMREENPEYMLNEPGSTRPIPAKPLKAPVDNARLYVHNVQTNESREITFEEAELLSLDYSMKSPDGFEMRQNHGGGSMFTEMFGGYRGNDYGKRYLIGNGSSVELNLKGSTEPYFYTPFQFFGWVMI